MSQERKSLLLFGAIALLAITQVAWWVTLFQREVNTIEVLQTQNETLRSQMDNRPPNPTILAEISDRARRFRIMFWSESLFFIALTLVGLSMLLRTFRWQEKARQQEKAFLQFVSHESKTPLTALKLRLESIQEEGVTEGIDLALHEVRRLTHLFENTLNLHRLESQNRRLPRVSLSEIVGDAIQRMEPLLQRHQVRLETDLKETPAILGDPQGLESSIQSIVENAIRYNPKDPKQIWVSVKAIPRGIRVEIEDNGPGIDPSDMPHLFDRFYRGKTSEHTAGTGVGLFIVKGITDAHGAKLSCLTGSRAGGCLFQIDFPEAT